MTTYNIPNTEDLLNTAQMPMGLVIQPLAKLRHEEVWFYSGVVTLLDCCLVLGHNTGCFIFRHLLKLSTLVMLVQLVAAAAKHISTPI